MTKKIGVFVVTGMMIAMMATGVMAEDLAKEDGTASLELKDQFNDEELAKTELKGTLENQTLKLQDTGLLKNIDYIDLGEEGSEPEPNAIVYFEKAE